MPDPILVAADGGRGAAHAFRLAAAYAEAAGLPVEILAVAEPFSDVSVALPHREELEQAHAQGLVERVRTRLTETVGPADWPVRTVRGRAAPLIQREARARSARLIVLGMNPSEREDPTAVELLHLAERPVVIAAPPPSGRALVVGIDFRPSSILAAREAVDLTGADAEVHLVHVRPSLDFPAASVWGWDDRYEEAARHALDRLAEELRERGAASAEVHLRAGEPVAELLRVADELGAALLAIGSDGYMCHGRAVVGRVARRLVSQADVPILATPVTAPGDGVGGDRGGAERPATERVPVGHSA